MVVGMVMMTMVQITCSSFTDMATCGRSVSALGTANGGARRGQGGGRGEGGGVTHVEEPQRFADVGSIGPGCM